MKMIDTELIGKEFDYEQFDHALAKAGLYKGSNWDYHYASYDHYLSKSKIGENVYLRISVEAVKGQIEGSGCVVRVNDVIIVTGIYHEGLHPDIEVPNELVKKAEGILRQVKQELGLAPQFTVRDATEEERKARLGVRKRH